MALFGFQNGFNVLLQSDEEGILVTPCLIDSGDQHLLNLAFRHCAGIAEQPGIFKTADTPPDDGLLATVVPMNPAVKLSAAAAKNDVRQAVAAAEDPVLPVRALMYQTSPHQFFLHLHKNFARDDGFVAVFHVILRHKAVVFDPLFGEKIYGVGVL
ncbi:hypothetical protein SDC9_137688 [bioreactor metagenome]|uniref:Uncharacterized protein n=1 Tax=bioreactor metagenome TaxID=1076179 RepID=A0A645DMN5_9ZZZZ